MISVVIPLYNKAATIGRTLESLEQQTYKDFEIVVVNDGSTDGGEMVIEKYSALNMRLVNQPNGGVASARNKGATEAKGEYVAFLDADDEWKPKFLETIVTLIGDFPDCSVFAVDYIMRKSDGTQISTIIHGLNFEGSSGEIKDYFMVATHSSPPICSSSVVVRKDVLYGVGGFPSGITNGEDLLTWARLACCSYIAYSKMPLAIYNLGEGYDYSNLPPRKQDDNDPVGKGLKELLKANPMMKGLRKYIGHWHKMRASVAMRYGEKKETIKECFLSLKYNPLNYKVLPFIILVLLPKDLKNKIVSRHTI